MLSTSLISGLGQEKAEKQPPSALEYCGQFELAIAEIKRNQKMPNFQALEAAIKAYNGKVAVRSGESIPKGRN